MLSTVHGSVRCRVQVIRVNSCPACRHAGHARVPDCVSAGAAMPARGANKHGTLPSQSRRGAQVLSLSSQLGFRSVKIIKRLGREQHESDWGDFFST